MYSLFISTYDELITIGLLKNEDLLSKKEKESNRSHSIFLIPLIKEILDENKIDTDNLNEIIVINGPGSFTGVRLGITVAKTLAYTLNIPIKTITSIEAIASSITNPDKIITISDTKGKYIGKFQNHKLEELTYLKDDLIQDYFTKNNLPVFEKETLNIKAIYDYTKNISPTPAHAVKAVYIKEIEALNGK
jgi:tRNA threonylcarbamoyl adenosine modification protein YeaZ